MASHKNKNKLKNELKELKEWQDNQFNPGHYIGTGRVPNPIKKLSKFPIFLIVLCIFILITPLLYILKLKKFSASSLILLIFGAILVYGGIKRIINKKSNKSA
ncbi:hypothetical protein [Thermohalobacter berrensis]|uniref:Uncharacterized protein n=1 Tax=Thermohalobacter berrensis TaxID=99594 RepID=A0A419SXQ4_9FIRM|nr:hypothetical protein [Thermohalobacter berrensis]RKD30014.1 hypothetical protein BET03_04735 [Thermohalobacter berrensis]